MSLYPLPNLLQLNDYNGNWKNYQQAVYQEFLDSIVNKLTFLGLPVSCRYFEPINGMHRSFWHLITENPDRSKNDEERTPDMRRCERIKWIAHIITYCNDCKISCWENKRKGNKNIVIWLESENYMIILSKRKDYYLLTTAYTHGNRKKKVNISEREKNIDPRNS